jgi:MinD-like ATPase involved in chromosome partitioning or flagellar assembly
MPRIISVHSYRGGTGKSNTTANLAATIALQGYRVGVIDTDIQSPGIHILFGLDEEAVGRSLNDYLNGHCTIEEAAYDVRSALEGEGVPSGNVKGIYLIPSSIKTGEITQILRDGYDVSLLNDGIRDVVLRLNLDYLLIDTHPGINEETLLSIAISDVLVLLLRPDRQDFQGTAVTVDVARMLDVPKLLLVVNKALSSFDFPALKQQVEQTYHAEVAGILPLSEDMIRLGSSEIFCVRFPDHPLSQEIRAIARKVME